MLYLHAGDPALWTQWGAGGQSEGDAASRLVEVMEPGGLRTQYGYDPARNLTGIQYPNRTSAVLTHDAANRLTRITRTGPGGVLADIAYTMDAVGTRLAMTEAGGRVTPYTYDALNHLAGVTFWNGLRQGYSYDAVGNRIVLSSGSNGTSYVYDSANRLLSAGSQTYTYDENGNIATKALGSRVTRYTFDAANRLGAVMDGTRTTAMEYDGDGNRVGMTAPNGAYDFLVDPLGTYPVVLDEAGPDGSIRYTYGLGLIAATSPGFRHIYHPDGLISTRSAPTGGTKTARDPSVESASLTHQPMQSDGVQESGRHLPE